MFDFTTWMHFAASQFALTCSLGPFPSSSTCLPPLNKPQWIYYTSSFSFLPFARTHSLTAPASPLSPFDWKTFPLVFFALKGQKQLDLGGPPIPRALVTKEGGGFWEDWGKWDGEGGRPKEEKKNVEVRCGIFGFVQSCTSMDAFRSSEGTLQWKWRLKQSGSKWRDLGQVGCKGWGWWGGSAYNDERGALINTMWLQSGGFSWKHLVTLSKHTSLHL